MTDRSSRPLARVKRATSYDVAQLAEVSQSAVSRALTPGAYISPALRDKVLEAARRLSYQPNAMARGLTTDRSRVVAVFMPNIGNPVYPDVLQHFSECLRPLERQVQLLPPVGSAQEALARMLQYRVDGLVITAASPLALSREITRKCLAADIPVVLFNRYFADLRVPSVSCDNVRIGAAAAEMMVAAGHRRFAFIGGPEATSTRVDRCKGYVERLAALGARKPLLENVSYNYEGGHAAGIRLFGRADRPDAVFCANDMLAIGALDAARLTHGLEVPRDVSFIGCDGAPMAAWAGNSLTTFQMRTADMVGRAVEQLMQLIERHAVKPRRVKVASELVVRASARLAFSGHGPSPA